MEAPYRGAPLSRTTASEASIINSASISFRGRSRSGNKLLQSFRKIQGNRRAPDSKGDAGLARPSANRLHEGDDDDDDDDDEVDEKYDDDGRDDREPIQGHPGQDSTDVPRGRNHDGERRRESSARESESDRAARQMMVQWHRERKRSDPTYRGPEDINNPTPRDAHAAIEHMK